MLISTFVCQRSFRALLATRENLDRIGNEDYTSKFFLVNHRLLHVKVSSEGRIRNFCETTSKCSSFHMKGEDLEHLNPTICEEVTFMRRKFLRATCKGTTTTPLFFCLHEGEVSTNFKKCLCTHKPRFRFM